MSDVNDGPDVDESDDSTAEPLTVEVLDNVAGGARENVEREPEP